LDIIWADFNKREKRGKQEKQKQNQNLGQTKIKKNVQAKIIC
jgi:hypothetical protein